MLFRSEGQGRLVGQAQPLQPGAPQNPLFARGPLVQADGVEQAGNHHGKRIAVNPVATVQVIAHNAHVAFHVPDGFAAAPAPAENAKVVLVAERMVAGDELHQGGFAAAVRPGDEGVLARTDAQAQPAENATSPLAGKAVSERNQRLVRTGLAVRPPERGRARPKQRLPAAPAAAHQYPDDVGRTGEVNQPIL